MYENVKKMDIENLIIVALLVNDITVHHIHEILTGIPKFYKQFH